MMVKLSISILVAIFAIGLQLESTCTANKRGSLKSHKSTIEQKLTGGSSTFGDEVHVRLLRPRRSTAHPIFLLSHVIALLRCISTVGAPLANAVAALSNVESSATSVMLPDASLPDLKALIHLSVSLCCHYGFVNLLKRYHGIKKLIEYTETDKLCSATAAYVSGHDIGEDSNIIHSGIVVPLRNSSIASLSECLTLLDIVSYSSNESSLPSTDVDGKGKMISKIFDCEGMKYILLQSDEQILHDSIGRRKRKRSSSRSSNSKKRNKRARGAGQRKDLTVVVAEPQFRVNLLAAQNHYRDVGSFNQGDSLGERNRYIGLTTKAAENRRSLFGSNSFSVPLLTVGQKMIEHFFSPMNMLQILFQFLSVLEEPLLAPISRIATTIFSDSIAITRENVQSKLMERVESTVLYTVLRDGKSVEVLSIEIMPGDILFLTEGSIPADCLILEGSCVVNEAIQTGEAVPQPKISIATPHYEEKQYLSFTEHQSNILFSGSDIVQLTHTQSSVDKSTSEGDQVQHLCCLVLRTGFYSSQGKLFQKMKALGNRIGGKGRGFLSPQQQGDVIKMLTFLGGCSAATSVYLYSVGMATNNQKRYRYLVQVARIIVSMASPDIQNDITFTVASAVRRLTREEDIHCMDPSKLATAGLVTACLFDKTGTISTDIVVADKVVTVKESLSTLPTPQSSNTFDPPSLLPASLLEDRVTAATVMRSERWHLCESPLPLQIAVACCHSLMELFPHTDSRYLRSCHS